MRLLDGETGSGTRTFVRPNLASRVTRSFAMLRSWSPESELERSTIQRILGKQEWFVMSWQALVCAVSWALDDYRPGWPQLLIMCATVMHIIAVPVVSRIGGPFANGPPWIFLSLAWVILFPCGMLLLVEPAGSSHQLVGIPMGNYAVSTLTVFAFYPWWRDVKTRALWIAEIVYVAVAVTLPGAVIVIAQTGPTFSGFQSAATVVVFNIAGYYLGRTIRELCRVAAQLQVEVQQQNYEEFFNFLHSHVKAGIAAIREELGKPAAMNEKLGELQQTISDRRIEFLLKRNRVPLALVFSERIRTFTDILRISETPQLGPLTVPREVGILANRALGDLLKNAALHGGKTVALSAEVKPHQLKIEIRDDGPGLNAFVLENETCSLALLRGAARALGGDLTAPPIADGTLFRLTIPLQLRPKWGDNDNARATR